MSEFEEPKPNKLKFTNFIVSPIPKKILSFSNNDNLQTKSAIPIKSENFGTTNPEDSSNTPKFVFHKNSAFRYFYKAMG